MIFTATPLPGAFVVDLEPRTDARGFFARTFCRAEFQRHGLEPDIVQCSVSHNRHRGTLRGLHYQAAPHEEAKLVSCIRGAIHDVIVDLRPTSPAFRRPFALVLRADEHRALYIPKGLAHGFLTLEDDAEVFYQMSVPYAPACARGVRWNDPAFGIAWPEPPQHLSERDRTYPDFQGPDH